MAKRLLKRLPAIAVMTVVLFAISDAAGWSGYAAPIIVAGVVSLTLWALVADM